LKKKRKETNCSQNTQVHAIVTIVGVTLTIVAFIITTITSSSDDSSSKISMAIVLVATLVTIQCVEMAKSMGANHEHMVALLALLLMCRLLVIS
jgi:hypothetical protein